MRWRGATALLTECLTKHYVRRHRLGLGWYPITGSNMTASSRRSVSSSRALRLTRAFLPALLLLLAPGCFKRSVMPSGDEADYVEISVSNNNMLDMTVYATYQSMRVRLGTVTTATTQHFTLSLHQLSGTGEFQLLADPIGSRRTLTSEAIHVFAGQSVEWTLQADLRQSSLVIRS